MRLVINGEDREVAEGINLSELVKILQLTPERVAVELNHRVVRRAEWTETNLTEGDRLEIVHFVGGGS